MSRIDASHIFRPLIVQTPGQPDPTSGDAFDLAQAARKPDPNVSGPCQVQSSPACLHVGTSRLDPTDMLDRDGVTVKYVTTCQPCFDHQADFYIKAVHEQ